MSGHDTYMDANGPSFCMKECIRDIILDNTSVKREKLTDDAKFEDLGIDSLDAIIIVMDIEEHYELDINDADVEKFTCINDIITYLEKELS